MMDKKDNLVTPPTLFRKIFRKPNSRVLPFSENNGGIITISSKPIDEKHAEPATKIENIWFPSRSISVR